VFKTILVGVDGSEGSRPAIPMAADLARRYGARLVLAHVDERIPGKGGTSPVYADEEEVREELQREAEALTAQGVETTLETVAVVLGGPAHAIEELAAREDADLIVVGRRGHSPVVGLLLGSVTQRLLHIARRPVLTAPSADAG
jgi:nucleotide-binding universal stress UspA family protein